MHRHTLPEHHRHRSVSEVVEPDARQTGLAGEPQERCREGVGADRATGFVTDDEPAVVVAGSGSEPFDGLRCLRCPQHRHQSGVERQFATRPTRFVTRMARVWP